MCIESNRSQNKKKDFDFSVFQLNIIHNNNKIKKFDKNILKSQNIYNDYSILSDINSNSNSERILKEQYDKEINNYTETIKIIEIDNNKLKLEITKKENEKKNLEKKCKDNEYQIKINKKEKKELEKEIIDIKKENLNYKNKINDYIFVQKKMNEYEIKYNNLNNIIKNKKLEIKIDNLNKYNLNIYSTRISRDENKITIRKIIKANDIIIFGNNKKRHNSFNNINSYNNEHFKIIPKKKKKPNFKKFNFSLNILSDSESSILSSWKRENNKLFIISKESNMNIIDIKQKQKNKDFDYDIIEPIKYEIDEYKHNFNYNNIINEKKFDILEISDLISLNFIKKEKIKKNNFEIIKIAKSSEFNILEKNTKNDGIINNLRINLNELKNKNDYFKLIIFVLKLNLPFIFKKKYLFFIKFQSLYYQNKISNSFKMFRALLSY